MDNARSKSRLTVGFLTLGAVAVIGYALGFQDSFTSMTRACPFVMGFIKLFFLGTFGEILKFRLSRGTWGLDKVLQRACVWGLFGLWFTLAFPGFSSLVAELVEKGLWPAGIAVIPDYLWMAFSKSLWINLLGMFAWGMMVSHEYFNYLIRNGWRLWSLTAFAAQADTRFVLSFLPKTLLFWVPAHTFTFAMPGEWRVFIAALLAIALGFLLSVGRKT